MSSGGGDGSSSLPHSGAAAAPPATSALAESWATKGPNSYYYAHSTTPSQRVVTTMGDAPRLLESVGGGGGGGGSPPEPAPTPITRYQYADEPESVTIYVPVEAHVPQDCVAVSQPSASSVLLTLAPPSGKKLALSLKGLSGAVSAVKARAGKTRVTLTLTKAEVGAWATLLKAGATAADDDF